MMGLLESVLLWLLWRVDVCAKVLPDPASMSQVMEAGLALLLPLLLFLQAGDVAGSSGGNGTLQKCE